jgi:hypothetical protein
MRMTIPRSTLAVLFVGVLEVAPARAEVGFPAGTQDFEAMQVGDSVTTLFDWLLVNTSSPSSLFTVQAADDVLGSVTPRGSSTKWLRVTDSDSTDVQNRFYSTPVNSLTESNYTWTFYVNLETTPPGGASTKPKLTIQHFDTSAFANAWGIEFTSTGANLIVLGIGGTPATTALYPLSSPTGLGDWVKLTLSVDFSAATVSAAANDGSAVSLPINLAGTADKKLFRFCYRGEGAGNAVTMLVDDVSVVVDTNIPTVSEWGLVLTTLLLLTAGTVALRPKRLAATS